MKKIDYTRSDSVSADHLTSIRQRMTPRLMFRMNLWFAGFMIIMMIVMLIVQL